MQFKTITNITTLEDLEGTIALADEITVDVSSLDYRWIDSIHVPGRMLKSWVKTVGDHIIIDPMLSELDRLVLSLAIGDTRGAQESLGILVRSRNLGLSRNLDSVLSVRGSGIYGVIVPDNSLGLGQVGVNPIDALAAGTGCGDIVYFYRSPEQTAKSCGLSGYLPVEIITDEKYDAGTLSLSAVPVIFEDGTEIQTPKIAAGDFDGDCSAVRIPHTKAASEEARSYWQRYWAGARYTRTIPPVKTWMAEINAKQKTDSEAFAGKVRQKPAVPTLTTLGWSLYTLALLDPDFPVTFDDLIPLCFKILDDGMKLKHKATGADIVIAALRPKKKLTPAIANHLIDSGYDLAMITAIRNYIQAKGFGTAREAAEVMSSAFSLKTSAGADIHKSIEFFLSSLEASGLSGKVAESFLDCLTGKMGNVSGGVIAPTKRITQKGATIGSDLRVKGVEEKLEIICGFGRVILPFNKKEQTIPWSGRTLVFRPVTYVSKWVGENIKTPAGTNTIKSWIKLIDVIARAEYGFMIRRIRLEPEIEEQQKLLENLVAKVMGRVRSLFEVDDPGAQQGVLLNEWRHKFIASQVVTMDIGLPNRSMNTLVNTLTTCAETWIAGGKVKRLCDTLPGEPGRVFMTCDENGRTVTEKAWPGCITKYIPAGRRPVLHATGNAADMLESDPQWVTVDGNAQPDHAHMLCAVIPQFFLDAAEMSDVAMERIRPVRRMRNYQSGGVDMEVLPATSGLKAHGPTMDMKSSVVMKSVGDMPIVQWADGTTNPVDVLWAYESESHQMMPATQMTFGVYTLAKRYIERKNRPLTIGEDITIEQLAKATVKAGIYEDTTMTCQLLDPNTGKNITYYDEENLISYSWFPVGYAPVIVHRQHPSVLGAANACYETPETYTPNCKKGGIVHGGMPSIFHAQGLPEMLSSTFSIDRVPASLVQEVQDLADMVKIVRRAVVAAPAVVAGDDTLSNLLAMAAASQSSEGQSEEELYA